MEHGGFDLNHFDKYRDGNRLEVKKANGGLPNSLWWILPEDGRMKRNATNAATPRVLIIV